MRTPQTSIQWPFSTVEPFEGRQLLTPEIAAQWLTRANHTNRKVKPYRVRMLAKMMQDGEWLDKGTGPTFDTSGNLDDGQHTCAACVQAGVVIPVYVRCNVVPKLPGTLNPPNEVMPDTVADLLKMGNGVAQNGRLAATALRLVLVIRTHGIDKATGPGAASLCKAYDKREIPALFGAHPGLYRSVQLFSGKKSKLRGILRPTSLFVALHHLCSTEDPDTAAGFFATLEHGQAPNTDPARSFREWLISTPGSSTREIAARFVRAWRCARSGRDMHQLRTYAKEIPNVWGQQ